MPRTTKTQELNNWIKGCGAHMIKVEFPWTPANKSVCIIAKDKDDAMQMARIEYPSATLIEFLGTIDKVLAYV